MSRRSIGRYLILLSVAFLVGRQSEKQKTAGPVDGANEPNCKKHAIYPIGVGVAQDDGPAYHCSHQRKEQKYWNRSIGVSIAALIFAGLAALFTGGAYFAANEQAQVAKKAFVENDRPIIDISFSEANVLGKDNEYLPKIRIRIDNIGNKPGYIRNILANIKAGPDDIGKCDGILGSRMVQVSTGLITPCTVTTLNIHQANEIAKSANYLTVSGLVNYKSMTGYCWAKKFRFVWALNNQFSPAHFYPDTAEKANDEILVDCATVMDLTAD